MTYENPQIPEGINVGRDNALLEFLRLAAGLGLVVLVVAAVLYFAGGALARLIPFETERNWVGERPAPGLSQIAEDRADIESYLQALSDRLSVEMNLPDGMRVRARFLDVDVPNAFASLGGQIAVTRGLYARLPTENALAMVLAHEIAHIRARDPIAGLGSGASMMIVLALATGDAVRLSGAFASLVQRGYSRRAETQADERAIEALQRVYGHAGGGDALFESFIRYRSEHGETEMPSLLSTHPLDAERIARLRRAAAGWDARQQPLMPIRVPAQTD